MNIPNDVMMKPSSALRFRSLSNLALVLLLLNTSVPLVAEGPPRVCRVTPTQDCSSLWADFSSPGQGNAAVVIITFDGDGYSDGAKATSVSAIAKAQGPLLFAVASGTHADAFADWFSNLALAGAGQHALCCVNPHDLPEVRTRAQELSGYNRPDHHSDWGSAAPAALYRVFLRKLFPLAARAVYVDADVIIQTDISAVVAELTKPMALPISATRSANTLKMRMDYCCKASQTAKKLLANATALENTDDAELLQEFQDIPASYREFNNGVMALDLVKLDEAGVFKRLERWFQMNLRYGLFNNDQHAWNLAATQQWQDFQQIFPQNSPSLEMIEASLQEPKPAEHLQSTLRALAFVHYTNQPKPWKVDWEKAPQDAVFDAHIWHQAFKSTGHVSSTVDKLALSVREVVGAAQQIKILRPASTPNEDFEYGMLYMEGSGGLGRDPAEARWRLARAAAVGDTHAQFMVDRGLDEELQLPDKKKLTKLERCWALSVERIRTNQDHQTLMEVYQMDLQTYHARKAPALVSACYWRIGAQDLGPRQRSKEEMELLFGSSGQSTPPLTPRLSKWLELVAKDQSEILSSSSDPSPAGPKQPPVQVGRWSVLPALGVLAVVAGALGWRVYTLHGGSAQHQGRKKKKKAG